MCIRDRVQELRRRASKSDVSGYQRSATVPQRRQSKYDPIRSQLEQDLNFRTLPEVEEQRRRLSRTNLTYNQRPAHRTGSEYDPVRNKLERELEFKSLPAVEEQRRRLSISILQSDNQQRPYRYQEIHHKITQSYH
eukprot:TRINITY_DN21452_c0_g1_i1.p1 TRINITY_DN21452_c0_g1~~TRINITY_DN21452_c0_g1_i1.p1  ORF type:complete len:143 (-),score=34.16 TRINITY_DN21452_c0_g1_i1:45-452(-)